MTELALLRRLGRIMGPRLLAVRSGMMRDVRPPEARGVIPRPEAPWRPRPRPWRHPGVQVMPVGGVAGAAHGGGLAGGGDLHRVRLLCHPRDQVEWLLVVIWTGIIMGHLE